MLKNIIVDTNRLLLRAIVLLLLITLVACSSDNSPVHNKNAENAATKEQQDNEHNENQAEEALQGKQDETAENDQDDSKQGSGISGPFDIDEQPGTVFYEIFVRSFYDSDGDGIGDLNGVTAKLDYLEELGIGGIWLMPINSSPSYHGYDTTDYYEVNPEYGTMDDLTALLDEAHKRDIKVIMDLVVNHSSSEHPWFKDAANNPESPYRSWYHFVTNDEQTTGSVSAAGSGNPWHSYGNSKYLGIFWGGMPDFNFDEPKVREELIAIGQFWLEKGLDGFRLDAAKHIYGDFNSTVHKPEVQAANQEWWQEFRSGMDEVNPDAFLIGEVWDSMAVIGPYFDQALDSAFNFDLADRLLGAVSGETDPDLGYSLGRTHEFYAQSSDGVFVDAPFLSNHDQNRIMTVLGNNVNHAKMAASLLLTLPGTPFLYYGEEIGMQGAKPDEHIREPMLWYADTAGGTGQTTWEQGRYNPDPAKVSVEAQDQDEASLLNHYRRLIKWRNSEPTLQNGAIAEYKLEEANSKLSLYVRATKDDRVLVVHNLSGQQQEAELKPSEMYGAFEKLLYATDEAAELNEGMLQLPPYSTVIIR